MTFGCGFATTSVGRTGVSHFDLTLLNSPCRRQKMHAKEDADESVRRAGQTSQILPKTGVRVLGVRDAW
jgi:hypothetical protein